MPSEWFAPPKTASELGITEFAQSPLLDDRDLPPVEERLPDDPVVSHPYERIGKYGGKARITLWDIWRRLHVSDTAIQPNYNYDDPKYRELVWGEGERRFIRALSHAIDRDQMNEVIYFGRGTPSQVTAHWSSRWYEKRFADAHIRYDPDYSRQLLDELGLFDVDGDGLREYPDGSSLIITLEYLDFETPKGIALELVRDYWREVGIDLRLKSVESRLQTERAMANKMQMTAWHADKVTDILFPHWPDWFYPHRIGWDMIMWNHWGRYHQSGGELGEEPPESIRNLQYWGGQLLAAIDEEHRTKAAPIWRTGLPAFCSSSLTPIWCWFMASSRKHAKRRGRTWPWRWTGNASGSLSHDQRTQSPPWQYARPVAGRRRVIGRCPCDRRQARTGVAG